MRAGDELAAEVRVLQDEGREKLHIHVSGRRPDARGPVQAA